MENKGVGKNTGQTTDAPRSASGSGSETQRSIPGVGQPVFAFHGVRTQTADPATGITSFDEGSSSRVCSSSLSGTVEVEASAPPQNTSTEPYWLWQQLLNEYINHGVLVRTHSEPNRQIKDLFSGNPVSACWLLPGIDMALYSKISHSAHLKGSRRNTAPGVIFSSNCRKVARFKRNAGTIQYISNVGSYDRIPKSSSLYSLLGLKNHKNHRNDYSFLIKMQELSAFRNCMELDSLKEPLKIQNSQYFDSSGHITNIGSSIDPKKKQKKKARSFLVNNEIVIQWSHSSNKLLGIMLQENNDISIDNIKLTVETIRSVCDSLKNLEKYFLSLPLVVYNPEITRLRYVGSIESVLNTYYDVSQCLRIKTEQLYALLNREIFTINLLDSEHFFDNVQRIPDDLSANLNIHTTIDFKALIISSCYRQMFEHYGSIFSNEEAIILSYAVAVTTVLHSIQYEKVDSVLAWFIERMMHSKVTELVIDTICQTIRACGCNDPSITPRAMLFRLIIINSFPTYSDWEKSYELFSDWNLQKWSDLIENMNIIKKIINEMVFPSIEMKREHSWILMLNEISLAIPVKVVETFRKNDRFGRTHQAWPFSEIMLSSLPSSRDIYSACSLLDQVEAFGFPEVNQHVSVQVAHYQRKGGLPRFPGTICSENISDRSKAAIERELLKQPSSSVISSIKSHFSAVSRSWEKIHYPVWHHNPLEGLENVPTLPSMKNWRGQVTFTAFGTTPWGELSKQAKPRTLVDLPDEWGCSICLTKKNQTSEVTFIELRCKHIFHQSCTESMVRAKGYQCPCCRKTLLPFRIGNQPSGTMKWSIIAEECSGENGAGTIEIEYDIFPGEQTTATGTFHYCCDKRTAFLPNHEKGRKALFMLKTAFERGLVLTTGHSLTRNITNVVTWNDIPHKTSIHGGEHSFPDQGYVDNLIGILKNLEVPEPV